ncbi:unnamed protein product [Mesocestoides corti]|uniref:UTP--glucose-1-phosphate uridylyltransferase n=2 Tax=Mesocestoides corti TaxID=53468 RepID=A0A158QTA1_MESCO|nr:unnamed protein product [Mesocestoides corti]
MEGVVSEPSAIPQFHSSGSFREVKQSDAEYGLRKCLTTMNLATPETDRSDTLIDEATFLELYKRFVDQQHEYIDWMEIKQMDESQIRNYEDIGMPEERDIINGLSHLVVVKLNGGLGTSMECCGPKSLISVSDEQTFLDLTLQQIETLNSRYNLDIPLVLMNSFNTQQDTDAYLRRITKMNAKIYTFEQNRFPRLSEETGLPFAKSMQLESPHDPAWYPPGHGDIYRCLDESGLLKKFIKEGKSWMFVSNIDNLGATPDPVILCWLEEQKTVNGPNQADFVMEVTAKTKADHKGGTLVHYKGELRLLELAQVPKEHMKDFLSPNKFNIFNTNNLWINLESMNSRIRTKTLQMDLIVNRKALKNGMRIIQLEEAVGAAIRSFKKPMGLKVPRSRFLPVKKTSDLVLLKSDLFSSSDGNLIISPYRSISTLPIVNLSKHFQSVQDLHQRIPNIPSMIELNHLTVFGDVTFGKNVVLKVGFYNATVNLGKMGKESEQELSRYPETCGTKAAEIYAGTVIIIAQDNEHIDIPDGSILEDQVVTGNLRIVDY